MKTIIKSSFNADEKNLVYPLGSSFNFFLFEKVENFFPNKTGFKFIEGEQVQNYEENDRPGCAAENCKTKVQV